MMEEMEGMVNGPDALSEMMNRNAARGEAAVVDRVK